MTLSRGHLLIRWGGYGITIGVLFAWAAEQRLGSLVVVTEILEVVLLASGTLVLLTGCLVACIRAKANRLLFAGAAASGVFLVLIPGLAALAHFDPNVHDWTGILFVLWMLSCLMGPAIVLVGLVRLLVDHYRQRQS